MPWIRHAATDPFTVPHGHKNTTLFGMLQSLFTEPTTYP
jgi:hypothetical protein